MPRHFYLHETVDIIGQTQYDYMDQVAREPVHEMPGLFRLQGTFFVIGASGARWPQCINVWDGGDEGWDAWGANLDRLNLKRRATFYNDWWDEAAEMRHGGFDRLLGAAPGCPTTADIAAAGIVGSVFVHEVLTIKPGRQLEYLEAVEDERRPVYEERGIHATGLYEVVTNNTEVVMIWATHLENWIQLRKDFDTTRGLDDTGNHDPRLTGWQSVQNRYVTGGNTELMTPRPGMVYSPPTWDG